MPRNTRSPCLPEVSPNHFHAAIYCCCGQHSFKRFSSQPQTKKKNMSPVKITLPLTDIVTRFLKPVLKLHTLAYNSSRSRRPDLPLPAGRADLVLLLPFPAPVSFPFPFPFRLVPSPPLPSPVALAPSPHRSSASRSGVVPLRLELAPPPPRDRRDGRRRAVNLPDFTRRFHIILPMTS